MRVLVCGSRTWVDPPADDPRAISRQLDSTLEEWLIFADVGEEMVVIEGGATGADRCARLWAIQNDLTCETFPADWEKHGKRAGYVRNAQMLEEGKPHLVLAFVDKPLAESKGTAMMVDLARKAGVQTYVIEAVAKGTKP